MHRIVPDIITENYRAKNFHGSFRAVGMFLDLSGFSALTDALMKQGQYGSEVLAGLMHNIFDPVVASIYAHGGKIVGYAGDGIMALFPVAEDDRAAAHQALASATEIQKGIKERSLRETSYGTFSFSAKIGLALGETNWGILHSRDHLRATYYFRGQAVDEAAGAEHFASPGEIYLARDLCESLSGVVTLGDGASFRRLEGIAVALPEPIPAKLPPVDGEISRIFVPTNVLERDERGEFRQAVNLFMRFPDPDDEALVNLIHEIYELQEKYGGMVDRLDFGDKGCTMLMLWGAPVAYENDIGRALNFVLDLQSRVDFPITAGVTYYIAHAGFLGGEMSKCYTCYGWGVNLASRFMMSAPLGKIWVDERVARRVKNRFEYDYFGAQKFKGFETEQKVYNLIGRKPHIETPHQGEFVGRESELQELFAFLEPLWRGQFAGLFGVWGEAGIGKSRLVYELSVSPTLEARHPLWAFCHSDQILRHSFNPFRYWLLRYFGFTSDMDENARKHIFDARLEELIASLPDFELAEELQRTRSALGSLLDLEWPNSLYARLDAEGRYNNTLLALIALLKAESLRQPLILFIEDAHFIDEESRALLPRLKRALSTGGADYPVAILLSARHSASESLFEDSLFTDSLELSALSMDALANLAEIQLGGTVSPELVQLVQERSEGNPFFVEQVLVYLQEEKYIEMSEQGWRITRRLQESSLPADIRALLMARLDQLDQPVREAIQTASVLGREFEVSVLSAMMTDRSRLKENLQVAERAEILLPVGGERFSFTHGLLRDSAYSMQMRSRRQELHFLAVRALEKIYENEIERHFNELAYHAERAEMTTETLEYLTLAGHQALELFQNARALDCFTRAIALTLPENAAAQAEFLLQRIEIYKRIGDRVRQWQDIQLLADTAQRLGDESMIARASVQSGHYHFTVGEYATSMQLVRDVLSGPVTDGLIRMDAYSLAASSLLRLGRLKESLETAQDGLRLARRTGLKREEARTLSGLGLICIEQAHLPQAVEYLQQALRLAREISDRFVEMTALNNLGNAAGFMGDYSMARDCYERCLIVFRERGDRYGEGLTLGNLGWVAGLQGDFPAAVTYHQHSLMIAREVGNPYQEAYTLINLSAAAGMQNDGESSLQYAQSGYDLCRSIGERSGEAWSLLNMGHAQILREELDLAQSSYENCLTIRQEMRQPTLAAEALAGLAQIALRQDDLPALSRHAEALLAIVNAENELAGAEDPIRVYYALVQALEKMKDPRSRVVLQQAVQLLDAQVSRFKNDDERRSYVENVPWRYAVRLAGNSL